MTGSKNEIFFFGQNRFNCQMYLTILGNERSTSNRGLAPPGILVGEIFACLLWKGHVGS